MSGVRRPRDPRPPLWGPVIVKQWNKVESILNEIGDSWKVLENPHLIDVDTEEPYLQEWNKVAQEYVKETFEMLGLPVVGGSIFVESEYDTFVNYLIGLSKNAASKGERLYPLPTNLPYIGPLRQEFRGVKEFSPLMSMVRILRISHAILRPPSQGLPERHRNQGVMESYADLESKSDLRELLARLMAAIRHGQPGLDLLDQRHLEAEMVQLVVQVEHYPLTHDLHRIVEANENYGVRGHANFGQAPPNPYMPLLARLLRQLALASSSVEPEPNVAHSLSDQASLRASHRRLAIYGSFAQSRASF